MFLRSLNHQNNDKKEAMVVEEVERGMVRLSACSIDLMSLSPYECHMKEEVEVEEEADRYLE